MKSVIYLMILIFSSSSFAAITTLDGLAGIYKLSSEKQIEYLDAGMSIEYKLAISTNKDEFDHNIIGLNEYIMKKLADGKKVVVAEVKCQGTAELTAEKKLISSMTCKNERYFEQKINLSKVKDLTADAFEAPVFTTLYGTEFKMKIERLKKISVN